LVSESLSNNQQYVLNNVGLSSNEAIIEIYQDETKNTHATMLKTSIGREGFIPIKAQVISGHEYCHQHNIMHIDFLKVDVEGAENSVLEGFDEMLSSAKISMIQFEYTELNIDSRFFIERFL
jgi:FkbM family methyltransferase